MSSIDFPLVVQVSAEDNDYKHNPLQPASYRTVEQGEFLFKPYVLFAGVPYVNTGSLEHGGPYQFTSGVNNEYRGNGGEDADGALQPMAPSLKRFTLNVAPLQYIPSYGPKYKQDSLLLNMDTAHLYTASGAVRSKVGQKWTPPTSDPSNPCENFYGTEDGVYSSPMPIPGAPVRFQKVYFNGIKANNRNPLENGDYQSHFAYFLCSSPMTNKMCTGPDAYASPRNENWEYMESQAVNWSDIDMGNPDFMLAASGAGFVSKDIVLCENGESVPGTILFKYR